MLRGDGKERKKWGWGRLGLYPYFSFLFLFFNACILILISKLLENVSQLFRNLAVPAAPFLLVRLFV